MFTSNGLQIANLQPIHSNQKSFGNKAKLVWTTGYTTLYSYDTKILSYDNSRQTIIKHWDGYSATTMRHINELLLQRLKKRCTKKEWEAIPLNEPINWERNR